jgi:hypothetical protein
MYLIGLYVSIFAYMFVYYTLFYVKFCDFVTTVFIYFNLKFCSKFVLFYINYAILDCLSYYMETTYLFLTVPTSTGWTPVYGYFRIPLKLKFTTVNSHTQQDL